MLAAAQRKPFSRLLAHDRVRAVLLAWVVLAALLLVLPAVAGGADTKEPGTNDVQPLWQGYPLNPGAGRVDRAAVTKRTTPAQPAARGVYRGERLGVVA